MAGAKKSTSAAAKRRCQELVGVTATPQGAACRRGRGTKKRIDCKRRRLKCFAPSMLRVTRKRAIVMKRKYTF